MAQFDVSRNKDPRTCTRTPFLLDIQSEILEILTTRLVVPLRPVAPERKAAISRLHPVLPVLGRDYAAIVSEMAGMPRDVLGQYVSSVPGVRRAITAACDLLFVAF